MRPLKNNVIAEQKGGFHNTLRVENTDVRKILVSIDREEIGDFPIAGVIVNANDGYFMMRLHDDGKFEGFTIGFLFEIMSLITCIFYCFIRKYPCSVR